MKTIGLLPFGLLIACSTHNDFATDADGETPDSAEIEEDASFLPPTADVAAPPVDATPPPPPPVPLVYAHGPNDLHKFDTKTKKLTPIGPFAGCNGSVIDMAIDEKGTAYCTTFGGFFKLDLKTANCTLIATGSYPNSLSFVPKGTLDATKEALVGYFGSQYVRIDTTTGATTTIGSLGSGYSSSGDIVSVKGGGTFLTVVGAGCGDCLLQVNPKTGDLIQNYGPINHSAVYGLAYWGGALYGFDQGAEIFEITAKGGTITTTSLPLQNVGFWGAGSSTSAPVADEDGGTIPIIK